MLKITTATTTEACTPEGRGAIDASTSTWLIAVAVKVSTTLTAAPPSPVGPPVLGYANEQPRLTDLRKHPPASSRRLVARRGPAGSCPIARPVRRQPGLHARALRTGGGLQLWRRRAIHHAELGADLAFGAPGCR